MQLDPDKLAAAIAAIKDGDGDAALAILEAILTGAPADDPSAAGADGSPEAGDTEPPPAGTPPTATSRALAPLTGEAAAVLMRLTGCATEAEALTQYQGMQERIAALSNTQIAIELNTRRGLIVELIKLGIETPALAWRGKTDAERAKRNPCKRLADEPISEMTARIATLRKLRVVPEPPAGGGPDNDGETDVAAEVAKLSRKTLDAIKAKGMTPEEFIAARSTATRRIG